MWNGLVYLSWDPWIIARFRFREEAKNDFLGTDRIHLANGVCCRTAFTFVTDGIILCTNEYSSSYESKRQAPIWTRWTTIVPKALLKFSCSCTNAIGSRPGVNSTPLVHINIGPYIFINVFKLKAFGPSNTTSTLKFRMESLATEMLSLMLMHRTFCLYVCPSSTRHLRFSSIWARKLVVQVVSFYTAFEQSAYFPISILGRYIFYIANKYSLIPDESGRQEFNCLSMGGWVWAVGTCDSDSHGSLVEAWPTIIYKILYIL